MNTPAEPGQTITIDLAYVQKLAQEYKRLSHEAYEKCPVDDDSKFHFTAGWFSALNSIIRQTAGEDYAIDIRPNFDLPQEEAEIRT